MTDSYDRLEVRVIAAKDLFISAGVLPSAFAEVIVGQDSKRTQVVSENYNPEWNESMMIFTQVLINAVDTIQVQVYHCDLFTGKNKSLGWCFVNMANFYNSPGITSDEWYDLSDPSVSNEKTKGSIRFIVTYFNVIDDDLQMPAPTPGIMAPNCLQVTILKATGIATTPVEAFVVVEIDKMAIESKLSKKEITPHWEETVTLPARDGNASIDVYVKQSTLLRNIFLGRCRIPMVEVAAHSADTGLTKIFTLLNENLQFSEATRGTIQLNLKWVYDAALDIAEEAASRSAYALLKKGFKVVKKAITRTAKGLATVSGIEDLNPLVTTAAASDGPTDEFIEEEVQADNVNELETDMNPFELELFLKQQAKKRKAEMKDILEIEEPTIPVPDGDYSIQVHIIEVLSIRGANTSGLSDPFVVVELMGQKQKTEWYKEKSSQYFDQTFYFNFKGLKKEQVQEAHLKISLYDHNYFRKHELLGIYSVDLVSVYNNKDHELYRVLAALRDPNNKIDSGLQGLLKFSVICLGPNDSQKIHDNSNEEDQEAEHDAAVTDGVQLATGGVPGSQTLQFLVVSVLRVEGFTGFDKLLSTSGGLYAFAQLDFAGCEPIKTTKVKISGRKNLTINFEEELRIPIWVPTLCKRGILTIVHRHLGFWDNIVATAHIDFEAIPRYPEDPIVQSGVGSFLGLTRKAYDGQPFEIINFYGADATVRAGTPAARFATSFPQFGSAYRGSAIVSMRVVERANGVDYGHVQKIGYYIPDNKLPQLAKYMLRIIVYQGSDLGSLGHAASNGTYYAPYYALSVSIGPHRLRTQFQQYVSGAVDWVEILEALDLPLPLDLRMLPDMFITLWKGSESSCTPIAFCRLKSLSLMPGGLDNPPVWYEMKHDMSHKRSPPASYPGSVLARIALMNMQDIDERSDWESARKKMLVRKPYALRVFVYQLKNMPSVDDNGLMDPYVKVRFAGEKRKTAVKSETLCPTYYTCLEFSAMLPEDRNLCPFITLQVWDQNALGSIPVCALRVSAIDVEVAPNTFSKPPPPKWMNLKGIDNVGDMGQVLVSFQFIAKKELNGVLPSPPELQPELKRVYLDLHIVGLRKLLPINPLYPIKKPFIQFSYGGERIHTAPSRQPSPVDPNYLDRQILAVSMPEDPIFTPILEIAVYDQRLTGTVLLGTINMDLSTKLPWNGAEYIPPRQHLMLESNLKEREKLQAERRRKEGRKQRGGKKLTAVEEAAEEADAKERDEAAMESLAVRDEGVGVFPIEEGATEFGARYQELPPVLDQDDLERGLGGVAGQAADVSSLGVGSWLSSAADVATGGASSKKRLDDEIKKMIGFPTAWASNSYLTGREDWVQSTKPGEGGHLEDYLVTSPFESYDLIRGHIAFNKFGKRRDTTRKVGTFKGVIRVTVKNPRNDEEFTKFAKRIRLSDEYVVRVYCIRAQSLMPVDLNGKADPYLKLKLGSQKLVDDKDAKELNQKTLNPEFYRRYDFTTTLPGASTLVVQVWDSNDYLPDRMLGETTIDLEDRWFHPKWTAMGDLKKLEARNIYREGTRTTQGMVLMWVDIFTSLEAAKIPPIQIEHPEKAKFEIRIVCWRSKDIPNLDNGGSDLFASFAMEGSATPVQETDVHWRCKTGAAAWNWRIKIPIELPIKSRELGRLKIQMWEKNIVTSNEIVGEATVNIYDWLLLAYHRKGKTIQPFKEIKDTVARRNRMLLAGDTVEPVGEDDDESDADMSDEDEESKGGRDDLPVAAAINSDTIDDENTPLLSQSSASGKTSKFLSSRANAKSKKGKQNGGRNDVKLGKSKKVGIARKKGKDKEKDSDDEGEDGEHGADVVAKKNDDADDENETSKLVNEVQQFLGIGDVIAEDAEWVDIFIHDRRRNRQIPRGRVAISIAIAPESETVSRPVGSGRDDPNTNPYLVYPMGRMSFSFNPLTLLRELCPWWVFWCLCCCCCCLCIFGSFMFVSTYLSGIESAIQLFSG